MIGWIRSGAHKCAPYVLVLLMAVPAVAVQPDEILDDPVLEARAREISKGLRCPVCMNESIDESNAPVSRDLRLLLRERLIAGDSDAAAVQFIVDRYGEFVLLEPTREGANLILWWAGPILLLTGAGLGWSTIRNRASAAVPEGLSEDEEARLAELLKR